MSGTRRPSGTAAGVLLFLFTAHKFFSFRPSGSNFEDLSGASAALEIVMSLSIGAAAFGLNFFRTGSREADPGYGDLRFAIGAMIAAGAVALLWTPLPVYSAYALTQAAILLAILRLVPRGGAGRALEWAAAGCWPYLIPVAWLVCTGQIESSTRPQSELQSFHPVKAAGIAGALCAYHVCRCWYSDGKAALQLALAACSAWLMLASGGKGGAAACVLAILIVVLRNPPSRPSRALWTLAAGALLVGAAAFLDYGLFAHLAEYARISESQGALPTLTYRFRLWWAALASCFTSVPVFLFGNGAGYSGTQTYDAVTAGVVTGSTGAHQSAIQVLSESGLLGGLAYFALIVRTGFVALARRAPAGDPDPSRAACAAWLVLLIQGMVDQVFSLPVNNTFTLFAASMLVLSGLRMPGTRDLP